MPNSRQTAIVWLGAVDSNHDLESQSLASCHWTSAVKNKLGGRVARPPGAESRLDVHQSIQQSVETTHDR